LPTRSTPGTNHAIATFKVSEVRAFIEKNPKYKSALHHSPHKVAGSAANLVFEVAPLIKQSAAERAVGRAKHVAETVVEVAKHTPETVSEVMRKVTDPQTVARVREDVTVLRDMISGKAMERMNPIFKKLLGKAIFENNPEVQTSQFVEPDRIAAE
jgi:hypothetical protein